MLNEPNVPAGTQATPPAGAQATPPAGAQATPPAGEPQQTPGQGSSPATSDKPVINTEAFLQSRIEQGVRQATKSLVEEIAALKELVKPKTEPAAQQGVQNGQTAAAGTPNIQDVLANTEKTNKLILINAEIAKRGDVNPKAHSEFIRSLNLETLKINPDTYTLEGFDDQVKSLKEQKDFLFVNKDQVRLGSVSDGIDPTKYAPEVVRQATILGIKDPAQLAEMQKMEEAKQRVLANLTGSPIQKMKVKPNA